MYTEQRAQNTTQTSLLLAVEWIVALCLASISAAVVLWQNSRLAVLWDLSYILENAYRMSLGQVPYRDFPFPYAPLTFLIQAAIIRLTGRVYLHHVVYCAIVGGLTTILTWRIILFVLRDVPRGRVLALILTAPLTALGVYAIYPHPFYDPDCTFTILVCLLLLLHWQNTSPSIAKSFLCGVMLIVPILVKQNTGLAFICGTLATLLILFGVDVYRRANLRKYLPLIAGLLVSTGIAVLIIHRIVGLENYIHWTIKFAAQRRTPAFKEMIGMYQVPALRWWLAAILVPILVLWRAPSRRIIFFASAALMIIPFVWPVVYLFLDTDSSERAERLVNLWPLVVILSVLSFAVYFRRRSMIGVLLIPVILATAHGAFMSQQLWGSTYALWPLFVILIATLIRTTCEFSNRNFINWLPLGFAGVLSLSLVISGAFYVRSHERLDYANLDDGDLTHSNLASLKGLATRGSWLTDFDELVAFANKEIPVDDGILCLPGEDLFYYTTGRTPKFPVLMFDHTINPYSNDEIVDLVRSRNIQWLIVKNELQLEEEPIEKKDELIDRLMDDFESVESLNNYEIYKRKSPDSDDSARLSPISPLTSSR